MNNISLIESKFKDIDISDIRDIDPVVRIDSQEGSTFGGISVSNNFINSLINRTNVPKRMIECVTPNTLGYVLSDMIKALDDRDFSFVSKNGIPQDIISKPKYQSVSFDEVISTFNDNVTKDGTINRVLSGSDYNVSLEMSNPNSSKEVLVGDIVNAGVRFSFSPIGTVAPTVSAYTNRLVCTNGAISNKNIFKFEYQNSSPRDFRDWFKTSVIEAYMEFNDIIEVYKNMTKNIVSAHDKSSLLQHIMNSSRLGRMANKSIKAKALDSEVNTMWDAFNLITWGATHATEDLDRINNALEYASLFSYDEKEQHMGTCPICRITRTV